MLVESAMELVNSGNVKYKPGWTMEATDYTKRFEGAVMVKFTFPAFHTERDKAKKGYPDFTENSWAKFPIQVNALIDDNALYYEILKRILAIESHEAREFFRIDPTCWAPFHPHKEDGMKRWAEFLGNPAEPEMDLKYGVA